MDFITMQKNIFKFSFLVQAIILLSGCSSEDQKIEQEKNNYVEEKNIDKIDKNTGNKEEIVQELDRKLSDNHTKVLIIGSGPAGYTAAIYAARASLSPILFSGKQIGGQLLQTTEVENFPGFPEPIFGYELMDKMKDQALKFNTKIIDESITDIDFSQKPFKCKSESGEYTADTIILATGATAKWLNIPGEEEFKGYGVSGCATCDGFFFKDKEVAVIGGGNTSVGDALYLANHASKVKLIYRGDNLKAEKVLIERLNSNPKIEVIFNTTVEEIIGNQTPRKVVTGIRTKNKIDNTESTINLDGVFVAIGHAPQTDLVKGHLELDDIGYVITKPGSTKTSIPGIFAAGDVADRIFRQAITAAGLGCMAAIEADHYIRETNK